MQPDADCLKLCSPSDHPNDRPQAQVEMAMAFDGFNNRLDGNLVQSPSLPFATGESDQFGRGDAL